VERRDFINLTGTAIGALSIGLGSSSRVSQGR
jgi:hypothetical protein